MCLGLSLCQHIMDVLGGEITAESTPSGEFRITLRLARQSAQGSAGVLPPVTGKLP